jgi:serine/threonine protein kinase
MSALSCGFYDADDDENVIAAERESKVATPTDDDMLNAVALKVIYSNKSVVQAELVNNEINILKSLPEHPNILKYIDSKQGVMVNNDECFVIATNLCKNGDLNSLITAVGYLPEEQCKVYFRQLLRALKVAHDAQIYHRDVKSENCLIDDDDNLVLGDWGLAVKSPTGSHRDDCQPRPLSSTRVPLRSQGLVPGTKAYLSPGRYTYGYDENLAAGDVWSAGVVLFSMLTSNLPFGVASSEDWYFRVFASGRHEFFWQCHMKNAPPGCQSISQEVKAMLNKIFTRDESQRPTIDELLSDNWLSSVDSEMLV